MKETEKMKDLWSWHRNKKCSGDWRVEKDAVCVAQHGHQQLPLCPAFSRSFLHLLSTLAPLPRHFLSVFIAGPPFLFLSLPRPIFLPTSFTLCYSSFFLFPPSFTLLPPLFFCISPLYLSSVILVLFLYLSLSLSLSQKISSPHLHLWVFVLGVEFSSSLCVFSLGCTYRYSVQFGSYKLNMLWISEPARNRHRRRKSIIS